MANPYTCKTHLYRALSDSFALDNTPANNWRCPDKLKLLFAWNGFLY